MGSVDLNTLIKQLITNRKILIFLVKVTEKNVRKADANASIVHNEK